MDYGHITKEIRETAFEWRVLIDSGNASEKDLAEFKSWRSADPLHADAYDRAVSVLEALGELTLSEIDSDVYGKLSTKSQPSLSKVLSYLFGRPARIGAAAISLALIIAAGMISMQLVLRVNSIEKLEPPVIAFYKTEVGETKTVLLTDGSNVVLGAGSTLFVSLSAKKRELTLQNGAALFEVESDPERPFSVKANGFTATALGTVFALRNNGGVTRLAVSEGRVEAAFPMVIEQKPSSLITRRTLIAGEKILATDTTGLSTVSPLREGNFAAWRENRLTYVGATLAELVADANRYSERPILLDADLAVLDDLTVTVSFDGRDVKTMLSAFPELFPIEVDTNSAEEIVISKR